MEKIAAQPPSLAPAILALIVLGLFGYLLFSDLQPSSRTEHDINPPIEIIEPPETIIIDDVDSAANNEKITQQEAEAFVKQLATPSNEPVAIDENHDQFVRHDSTITLPNIEEHSTTIQSLLANKNIDENTPLTLHYVSQDNIETTLAALSDSIEDHTAPITIITADGRKITQSLAELLVDESIGLTAPITYITLQEHQKQTTLAELKQNDLDPNQVILVTIQKGSQELSVKALLHDENLPDDALFYLHRVTENDVQGLWGIIQTGLINKFRQGLHIEGISPNKEMIQAVIPANADEKLSSGLSSFLGKLLTEKVDNSYVYNLNTKKMGHDSNMIHPGQQLIMIHFSPDELKQVYQFFSVQRNQGTETFAITN